MSKQDEFTKSARGQECQVRIPGHCNGNSETTVLCHFNGFRVGHKALNIHAAFGCSGCHSWLDHGYARETDKQIRDLYHLEAILRTQQIWVRDGLLEI